MPVMSMVMVTANLLLGHFWLLLLNRYNAGTYVIFGHSSTTNYGDIDLVSSTFTSSGFGFQVNDYVTL